MRAHLADGRIYRMSFRHYREGDPNTHARIIDNKLSEIEDKLGLRPFRLCGATECFLWAEGQPRPSAPQGVGGQSVLDPEWDPEKGRRAALARALVGEFPKTDPNWHDNRTAVWNAYFSRGVDTVVVQMEAEPAFV